MTRSEIVHAGPGYIACLNSRDWSNLHRYVADQVKYDGKYIGLVGYQTMLVGDFKAIPDLSFNVSRLVCYPPIIACSLAFDCTPVGELFDLPVNDTRVQFNENVFYEFEDGKIMKVWSVIGKAAIAAQI
jgi:predicted ester cyclase